MNLKKALTFGDVLLVPKKSNVLPTEVNLETNLTKNIKLNIPILSAAMDTVTEHETAISLANHGGMGVIHKNLSIKEQAKEVKLVKRFRSGIIGSPYCLKANSKIEEAHALAKTLNFSSFPVVNDEDILIGIVTNRDLRNATNKTYIEEIMSTDLIVANETVSYEEAKEIMFINRIEKLPIVNKKNKLKGLITMKDIDNITKYPSACIDDNGRLRVAAAIGNGPDWEERATALIGAGVDVIFLDSAHGHSQKIIDCAKAFKKKFPNTELIAGNIVTAEAAKELIEAGVDGLKVGIGPGSICTTRVVAGVGVPQITAIYDVYQVAKKKNIPIIADGGIVYSGDIVKALACGASSVMLGSIFAGTQEAPGEELTIDGEKVKTYIGMGSLTAMIKGSKERYFQGSVEKMNKLVPEGIESIVPYKGPLKVILHQMIGGIKSGFGYCGAKDISSLVATAEFVEITTSGAKESHPHDVRLHKDSPNYS